MKNAVIEKAKFDMVFVPRNRKNGRYVPTDKTVFINQSDVMRIRGTKYGRATYDTIATFRHLVNGRYVSADNVRRLNQSAIVRVVA